MLASRLASCAATKASVARPSRAFAILVSTSSGVSNPSTVESREASALASALPRREGFFRWVHLSCSHESHYKVSLQGIIIMKVIARSHCKESLQGVIARSHCKESLQGVIARSHGKESLQGVMARSHCKESWQGVIARSQRKESWQGVIARSHGKESWQGVIARSHCKESAQGVIARSHCKESAQGVIARSHCSVQEGCRYLRVHLRGSVHGRLQGVSSQGAGVCLGGLQPRDGGVLARKLGGKARR